jgi:hypothetical protein
MGLLKLDLFTYSWRSRNIHNGRHFSLFEGEGLEWFVSAGIFEIFRLY